MKANANTQNEIAKSVYKQNQNSLDGIRDQVYVELSENPIVEVDVIAQLRAQLGQLEDLQKRHSFMMREVRYLLKM